MVSILQHGALKEIPEISRILLLFYSHRVHFGTSGGKGFVFRRRKKQASWGIKDTRFIEIIVRRMRYMRDGCRYFAGSMMITKI